MIVSFDVCENVACHVCWWHFEPSAVRQTESKISILREKLIHRTFRARLNGETAAQAKVPGVIACSRPGDPVFDAIRAALAEDAEDFEAFDARESEPDHSFEDAVKDLKRRGKL